MLRLEGKGSADPYEIRIFNSDREIIWIKINSESIFSDEDGSQKLIGIQSFVENITHQKKAEAALRFSEERLEAILEANPDPMIVYDLTGYPQYLNPAFTNVFGWHLNELKGKTIPFVPEDQKKISSEKIKEIFEQRKPLSFETKRLTKNNKCLDVLLSAAVNKNDKGNPIGMVVNLTDITDKKTLAIQYEQAQKMESVGTLAGGIAHDFNNILFPILGYTEMLKADLPEDSPFQDSLNKIYTGALRAKNLVRQILTFSRQERADLKLMKMQPIIKEALKFIRSTIPTTIDIKQEIQADCGVIKADPTQIHQVIMNLTTNAYHAMEDTGGELKVNLKEVELKEPNLISTDMEPGVYTRLKIVDQGIGMDKDLIQKIFNPFFTTKAKGTGMGLSVVHGIVKSMNGAIQVYSELGKGTEFNIYIPVEKGFPEEQKIQVKQSIQGGTEQILLVDDEEGIITMEKQMLERLGYIVTSRTSSIEALEAFRINPDKFDLVITDMAMPGLPGDKLSGKLTQIRPEIPILLCTGFSETMSEEKAASLGITGILFKPIVMKDLSEKIREVLDGAKSTSQQ
jgi:PAS domain S-box-containing protein